VAIVEKKGNKMYNATREQITEFLDKVAQVPHRENEAKLLRTNFGLSRENARAEAAWWIMSKGGCCE